MTDCTYFLRDVDGSYSWKRAAGTVLLACIVAAVVGDFVGQPLHDTLLGILAATFGTCAAGATIEHFSGDRNATRPSPPP